MIRRLLKTLLFVIIVLALIVAAGLYFADYLAKRSIEKGGKYALGVDTRAKRVDLEFTDGTMAIEELVIKNPDGFDTPHLMQFKKFDVAMRIESVLSDTIDLDHFVIESLGINVEQKGFMNNVGLVLAHLRGLKKDDDDEDDDDDENDDDGPGGIRVRVDRVLVKDVVTHFQATGLGSFLGGGKSMTVRIAEIELRNVTSDNPDGILIHELFARIVPKILEAVLARGADEGLGSFSDILSGVAATEDFGITVETRDLPEEPPAQTP